MVDPQASRFGQTALQSGLIDAPGIQACWEALAPDKRIADQIDRRLARQAVQAGLLTIWQARQLLAGRSTGFRIDRYLLLDLIGQGGMGRVFLAKDTRLGRRVALKLLTPERVKNARAVARFQREARVGAQLQHENLVRIYDEGEANGRRYLVMEYIEGKNLGVLIAENGPLPPATAARLARQVALGLEHAYQKGLIHRDVNPSNILVTYDGTAKLADLGLAIDLADHAQVTRDGATVGTFDYVSPEQARHSHAVDTRSDIYSLGCTLYHMISGRVPFPTPSLSEKLFAHQALEPEPLTALAPRVPPGLDDVVRRMMRKSPDERFSTPLAVAQALEPFTNGSSGAIDDDETPLPIVVQERDVPPTQRESAPGGSPPAWVRTHKDSAPDDDLLNLLPLDFGPATPLSGSGSGLKSPRSRDGSRRLDRLWVIGLALVALVAAVAIVVVGLLFRETEPPRPTAPITIRPRRPDPAFPPPSGSGANRGTGFLVRSGNGVETFEKDLKAAMDLAIGSRGSLLLCDPTPVRLSSATPLSGSGGKLEIRAAPGVRPVLMVEITGRNPFLSTNLDTPLVLVGVKIEASFAASNLEPPPVIQASAAVQLERCAFVVKKGDARGTRAVVAEGGHLSASGCWFEGFDRALDVTSFAASGSAVTLKQCMMVGPMAGGKTGGWAVRIRNYPGSSSTVRKLSMERCTVKEMGLFDLVDFDAQYPYTITVRESAALVDALLAWEQSKPNDTSWTRKALHWSGQGNQYEVGGESWVVRSSQATTGMPGGPTDLTTWTSQLASETETLPPPIRFESEAARSRSRSPQPHDLTISSGGLRSAGADPDLVGPGWEP